jgi:tRNA nucleotidyltransferase (CCA-adding enzyme)
LFNLLTQAAEQYESGMLSLDPIIPPTEGEDVVENIKFGGGFTAEQRKQLMQQQQSQEGTSIDGIEEGATTDDINGNALQQQQLSPTQRRQFIEIRIAGGWVRDKLLNQHSVDVDVALDCMMGVQFAKIVQRYMMMTMTSTSLPSPLSSPTMSSSFASSSFDTTMEATDKSSTTNSEKRRQPSKQPKKNQPRKQPKIGVIGANPSQSKHLETATMNVHGMDVDFVNLRAEEVYELDSRIPTSKTRMFGTPLEDALRRDFTINSLFYNIRTHKIEDWTGRGLDDLFQYRRIVTPVDPHMTFHDDPLRVLRAIRFAVRLNFTLDETIKEAAMSHRVHHSLHAKVSRERVGKEVEGMLSGKHARPGCALNMIAELHLAGSVFAFPGSFPGDHGYYVGGGKVSGHILGVEYDCSLGAVAAAAVAAATTGEKVCIQEAIAVAAKHRARGWEESSSLLNVLPPLIEGHADEREKIVAARGGDLKLPSTVLDKRLLHLCVFILPFHNLIFPDKKGRLVPVTTHMVKEALKFSNQDIQAVTKILSHVDEMVTILTEIRSQMAAARLTPEEEHDDSPIQVGRPCRLRIGLLLRSLKEHWVTCLITAAAWEVRTYQRLHENDADGNVPTASISMEEPSRELYRVIIETLALDECWKAQPHFNGQQVIKELSLPTGPLVGVFLDDQIRWMLLNPSGTKEQCLAHLQQRRREREEECIDQSMHGDAVAGGGMEKDSGAMHPSKKSREK